MKLTLSPRQMLIVQMQAYAYTSIKQGNLKKAELLADEILASFDMTISDKPCDSKGYWACSYFSLFQSKCNGGRKS